MQKSIPNDMKELREWERVKRSELKRVAGEKAAIDQRVLELRGELFHINQGKAMAYKLILESQKQQDQLAADYTDFITLMNNADELAHKKDVAALKVSSHMQVERFMYRWNSDKGYRDEYMRKTQPTLYSRGLGADGRIRNPAEEEERLALELGTPPLSNQQTPPKAKFKWGMDSRKSQ
ncbi:hypothetical protein Nepgr_009931 [Nepenthes gracilis]|uniref:Uncharacterized protein n=1 Tax=Nepenthes gracilis TaxID=150966 RepID=A0AAD3SC76_NEPGR|nr:hypothetical protein Nepgr_009931 [Nepenthes gracilis]